ncbi:MAG: helix-turn-helix domain-containing protein [Gammaproteobacteria bacterium]|nr:helix-turn-helix domain-containing protein [Gammaproteobacteria bacterium]
MCATPLSRQEVACDHCGMFGLCEEAGLSRDMALLERVVHRRTALARRATLFHAGDPFRCLYAVKSGALAAVSGGGQGDGKILGFYFPGDILGLDALESDRYPTTVMALEKSVICRLEYGSVPLLGAHQAGFYQQLIRAMSRQLMAERWTSLLLGTQSTEQRMAAFVLFLSLQLKRRGLPYLEFRMPMTRRDIGDYLGMAMETVSRAISALQKRGFVVLQGRNTKISNLEGLREMAAITSQLPDQ